MTPGKLAAMRAGAAFAQRWPRAAYLLADAAASFLWVLRRRLRRTAVENLLPVVGTRRAALRYSFGVFRSVGRYYVDLALIPRRAPAAFERAHVYVENPELLPLVDAPGPTVFVTAHYGHPDQLVQFLTTRRPEFVALVEPLRPAEVGEFVNALRAAHGGRFLPIGPGAVRRCLEQLRAGGAVALVADRDLTGGGVCVELCGRWVRLPRGPWELARRTGARVVPVFFWRVGREEFAARIEPEIVVSRELPLEAAVARACREWARLLERHLRRHPDQWLVLEPFWEVHGCHGEG